MNYRAYTVLFLCTANSARSIFAEALLNRMGKGRFLAYSAGSHAAGQVHPYTLDVLEEHGISADGLRSKNWDEFARTEAPTMDFVITVCDKAAGEQCPVWPGQPMTAHWGFPDPAAAAGDEMQRRRKFERVYLEIARRIELLLALPVDKLDRLSLQQRVRDMG